MAPSFLAFARGSLVTAVVLALAGCTTAVIQAPPPPPPPPEYVAEPPPPPPPAAAAPLSPMEELCAPVALYPDPLVSLLLPAATFPDQVSAAASYLSTGGSLDGAADLGWNPSVIGLSHYPTVIQWMAANQSWTSQLGGAFAAQPAAVMDAIQQLRRRAESAGALFDTPQQRVLMVQGEISIVPARTDVIYVPQYDPAVVYVVQPGGFDRGYYYHWSRPYPAGVWLSFEFDWRAHHVWTGDWYNYRVAHGGWGQPVDYGRVHVTNNVNVNVRNTTVVNVSAWHAPQSAPPPPRFAARGAVVLGAGQSHAMVAHPGVISGAPRPPANAVRMHTLEVNRPARPAGVPSQVPPANRSAPTTARSAGANQPIAGSSPYGALPSGEPRNVVSPENRSGQNAHVEPQTRAPNSKPKPKQPPKSKPKPKPKPKDEGRDKQPDRPPAAS